MENKRLLDLRIEVEEKIKVILISSRFSSAIEHSIWSKASHSFVKTKLPEGAVNLGAFVQNDISRFNIEMQPMDLRLAIH